MQSTIDQNNESTIAREKSRRREQVVVGLLGRLLRAGPFRFTIFFMYAAYLAVSGDHGQSNMDYQVSSCIMQIAIMPKMYQANSKC